MEETTTSRFTTKQKSIRLLISMLWVPACLGAMFILLASWGAFGLQQESYRKDFCGDYKQEDGTWTAKGGFGEPIKALIDDQNPGVCEVVNGVIVAMFIPAGMILGLLWIWYGYKLGSLALATCMVPVFYFCWQSFYLIPLMRKPWNANLEIFREGHVVSLRHESNLDFLLYPATLELVRFGTTVSITILSILAGSFIYLLCIFAYMSRHKMRTLFHG